MLLQRLLVLVAASAGAGTSPESQWRQGMGIGACPESQHPCGCLAQELVPSHSGGKGLALEPVPSHSTHGKEKEKDNEGSGPGKLREYTPAVIACNHAALWAPDELSGSSGSPEVLQPNSAGSADAGIPMQATPPDPVTNGGKDVVLESVPSHSSTGIDEMAVSPSQPQSSGGKEAVLESLPSHCKNRCMASHRGGKGLALEPVPSHSTHASNHAALRAANERQKRPVSVRCV